MKKILLLLLLVCAFSLSLFSQDEKFHLNPWNGLNGVQASVGFINHLEADVSFIMTNRPKITKEQDFGLLLGFHTISMGVNYANSKGHSFIGGKTYFQATLAILTTQLGFDYMSDFKNTEGLRFTPKAGLTLMGFASVLYGRNYSITGNLAETGLTNKGALHLQIQIPMNQN